MAVLEKIRVKLGIFITIIIALALLSFIIDPNTLSSAVQMFSSENKVGEMNGKSISYKDFYTEMNRNTKLFELQQGSASSEEAQQTIRNMAWQSFFDKEVFLPKAEKAGINVGSQEMIDLTQGRQISPVLAQQQMFMGKDGQFSREALARFVQSISSDETGNAQLLWDFIEDAVYRQQVYSKYISLIRNSYIPSEIEIKRAVADNNIVSDVDFVMMPIGFTTDSTINITPGQIKEYYNARKHMMRQPANRDIEYVVFEVAPSQQDIDDIKAKFDELYLEFQTSDNLKNFIALNSDSRWSNYYFSEEELQSMPEFKKIAFDNKDKAVASEINKSENMFSAARLVNTRMVPDSVKISYSLFPLGDEKKADSVVNAINNKKGQREKFAEYGWMTQNQANANGVPEFDSALLVKKGEAVKVKVSAMQAYAVLYVEDATAPKKKVQLAIFTKNISPSEETYRDYLMKATDLSDRAEGKYSKFAEIVKEEKLPVIPVSRIFEGTRRIGSCDNARELVRWAFDAKKGEVSDVITVENKYYFVAALTGVRKEGYADINDVKQDIKMSLMMEKKGEKLRDEVAAKVKDVKTIEQVAEVLGTTVSHQAAVSFGSTTNRSLDPKFIGAVAGAQQGVLTGPVAGDIGVYMFYVADKQSGTYYTEKDAIAKQAQNSGFQLQALRSVMTEEADVKDHRARFF